LVDACKMPGPIGTWRRIDAHTQSITEDTHLTSTHGFSVSQAISLAKNLGKLPKNLILYVINGDSYTINDTISPPVVTSIGLVIKAILSEKDVQACMNTVS